VIIMLDEIKRPDIVEKLDIQKAFLTRYKNPPLPKWIIYAANYIFWLASAGATCYLPYWAYKLNYPNIYGLHQAAIVILALVFGLGVSVALYLYLYKDEQEHIYDSINKNTEPSRGFFARYFSVNNANLLILRLTAVFSTMIASWGVIDQMEKNISFFESSRNLKEDQIDRLTAEKEALIHYTVDPAWLKYRTMDEDGDKKNDAEAYAGMQRIEKEYFDSVKRIDGDLSNMLALVEKSQVTNIMPMDNTAVFKFLSGGSQFWAGVMLLIVILIWSTTPDSGLDITTRIIARVKTAQAIEKAYAEEIKLMESFGGNWNGNLGGKWKETGNVAEIERKNSGGEWDPDLNSPLARKIIKTKGLTGESNRQIAEMLDVTHTTVNAIIKKFNQQKKIEEGIKVEQAA
jgi:hypothetical protein